MTKQKLTEYYAKRDFTKTPEPKGSKAIDDHAFVIHKHNASHLHYDLRLEVNGVLKSWAVPKGMPRTYAVKHLAIQTEDHPLEYLNFAGTIPAGQYGAGTVEIWDIGKYVQIDDEAHAVKMDAAIKKGLIKFKLISKRYNSQYTMIKFKNENNKNQWLLFKSKVKK